MKLLKSSGTSTICKDSTCARSSHASVFFFQAEDGIRDGHVTGVQTCALPIFLGLAQSELHPASELRIENDNVVGGDGRQIVPLATLLGDAVIEETREFHPRATHRLDPETGQADAHMQYAFAAHRAVVDVDAELGLVKVVELATAQDVGKAINPL